LSISLSINTYIFLSDNLSLPGLAKLILKTSFNREFKPLFTYEILIQPYIWKTTFIWYTLRNFFLFRLPFFSTLRSKLFKFVLGNYNGYQYLKFDHELWHFVIDHIIAYIALWNYLWFLLFISLLFIMYIKQ
jgi:hypothetical protein